jgi:hypothetical protein
VSDRLFVATYKGLFRFDRDTGGRWSMAEPAFLGEPVSAVLADPRDGIVYAALNLGHFGVKLHRSSDAGASFEEVTVPRYPEKPTGLDDPTPWSLAQVWCLEPGGTDEEGQLWAGTVPGGLFRSRDRAASWELVRPLWDRPDRLDWTGGGYDYAGVHSICVDPRDAQRLLVGISIGGVWLSKDAGASWEPRTDGMFAVYVPPDLRNAPNQQDPHRVVQCPDAPEVCWAQHHNAVFRSRDGAASWQELPNVTPSVFGFAVAVHPHDPEVAWFVPAVSDECRVPVGAQLVVARTRDGGESFEALRSGLPQERSYDLVYRHGLDVDASGERLAMGSTTGGLWVSENQGDQWTCLSEHLPPIHAVRFAEPPS